MNDNVTVSHKDIFALCSLINSRIRSSQELLNEAELAPNALVVASLILNDLYDILDEVLDIAPDDIRDFFLHYEEIIAACPF